MTETSKDFKRIEAEKWEEKSKDCMAAYKQGASYYCPLTGERCCFQLCLFVYWQK
jgi:hypothetical protein